MQTTLSNGLRAIHIPSATAVSWCGFMVDCGTRDEASPAQFGLAHFIEHILFKGTRHRDSFHINQRMESVGGELNAFTTKENTTFYSVFLAKHFPRACELLCDLVIHPTAPQHELEKEREVVTDEIESYLDTPSENIFDEFENVLFEGHPLGHNILGTADTVRTFDSATCLQFIRRHYRPDNMVFFYYGSTPENEVLRTLEKYAQWPTPAEDEPTPPRRTVVPGFPYATAGFSRQLQQHTHQEHVLLGCPSFPVGDDRAPEMAILNNILGGPGMNSRLNRELRERRGLVYTVESFVSPFIDSGYFSVYLGCDHKDAEKCMKLCRREMLRLAEDGLTAKQLEAAKTQLKGQYAVATANLENIAVNAAKSLLRLGRIDSLEDTCRQLDRVTEDSLRETARQVFCPTRISSFVIS